MLKLFKLLFSGAVPAPWDIWTALLWALPFISGGAAVIAGYVQDVPLSWVIMIAALTFGGTATGLLRFSEWRQRLRVADKLSFSTGRIGAKASGAETREIVIGFELLSVYDYPLECELTKIASRMGDRVPQQDSKLPQVFEVPPRGIMWFDDMPIDIGAQLGGALEGIVEFEVKYGRKGGRRKYTLRDRKRLHLGFDDTGKLQGASWTNAIQGDG